MTLTRPTLLPTGAHDETFAGVTYHIEGELVPVLTVEIQGGHSVYFEHHIMLWKHPTVSIGLKSMKGALKRMIAGMQIFVTEATGQGQIAFSRDGAGHIFALHLKQGEEVHVREHQFLAATQNVDYSFERVKGISNILMGGTGFFIDKFKGHTGDGILWLHGYGNVFEKVLAPGEQIEVEPGGWLYKDVSVRMESNFQRLTAGLLGTGGFNFVTNRFTGPGRVGIQSMYVHYSSEE
ncbi:MAG: AIM24 family protein [Aggregatilineales bacterium]